MTSPSQVHDSPVLADAEAGSRILLLAELQAALQELRIPSVLARNHKLVLRDQGPYQPSGLTDPRLYIMLQGQSPATATTDGVRYRLGSDDFLVADPVAAAAAIYASRPAPS